ncbi:probable phospholipid hydroperoxide glutathione peroxidase [Lycium barbarum]|uniref:probable phospholipid hydroperoxide glutathione peroxidase n=1 Tax=Lycium barbarum TaxID=112863 RepID=UPI00293EF54C|nr:probable phospholipid hydroperoxide glutathione peroxidase [Lycium barbarum]XP_060197610.1 probable phospholipid hydroperoxide glutathione peroxidase [Lycium barbarum]
MSRSRVYQALAEEDIEVDAKGNDVDLSIYKGKVLIIVNVASQWKDIKKYYGKNHSLSLILINVNHITKLLGEQGREEYMVLDLKHKVICFLLERTKLCTNNT